MNFNHKSVLLDEVIESLNIKPDGYYVDGTLGGAGHALEFINKEESLKNNVRILYKKTLS